MSHAAKFMAALTAVNTEMAFYILGSVGADDGWPDHIFTPDREDALGVEMERLGKALQERARGRRKVIEGTTRPLPEM
ncbi:hypothetical protein ACQPW3_07535 [Actinosynnema sp. CA-248983]